MWKARVVLILLIGVALLYSLSVRPADPPSIEVDSAEAARADQTARGAAVFVGIISHTERDPVKACRAEPENCQRFIDLYHTWLGAMTIEEAIKLQPPSVLPATSDELTHEGIVRTDVWGRPYCLFRRGNTLAVVSRGPKGEERTCEDIKAILPELFRSWHWVFQRPRTGEVVIIGGRASQNAASRK